MSFPPFFVFQAISPEEWPEDCFFILILRFVMLLFEYFAGSDCKNIGSEICTVKKNQSSW
jgi:hypothetical protein